MSHQRSSNQGGHGNMLKGLTNRSASAEDKSTKLGKESVNSEATRSETAATEPTLGPRCA
jgi:hypothetical protein